MFILQSLPTQILFHAKGAKENDKDRKEEIPAFGRGVVMRLAMRKHKHLFFLQDCGWIKGSGAQCEIADANQR
jgi:hypothetical protein